MKDFNYNNYIKRNPLLMENESPFSRDGWNEEWFDEMGLLGTFDEIAALYYEIKNARRGSYATDGTLEDLADQIGDLGERLQSISEEIMDVKDRFSEEEELDENINEEKSLTYNDFVQMVRGDMMAGSSPDDYISDERVRKNAKYLYNRYLQGASVDDLFESESGLKATISKVDDEFDENEYDSVDDYLETYTGGYKDEVEQHLKSKYEG